LDAPENQQAAAWLEKTLSGPDPIGFPLVTIWGFLRVSTNSRILANPLPATEAFRLIRELLDKPGVALVQPGPRHLQILQEIMVRYKVTGPLTTDAVIAALALEHGATLASTDRDFARFDTLKWINPVA
jgi:uncharacterized protein